MTTLDVLFMACVVAVLLAMSVPQALATRDHARGVGAARYLAARMTLARAQAISRSATVALRFEEAGSDVRIGVFADGNGNGVRTYDIDLGVDPRLEDDVALGTLFPGVTIAEGDESDGGGVRLGRTTLLSFTPEGTASSGTIYLRGPDGAQWAVRVLGATARTRVLRRMATTGEWVELR